MPRAKTAAPMFDPLDAMLTRLQLPGIRDQLDNLLDEAARANLSARETLAMLCEREITRKDHRRMSYGQSWCTGSGGEFVLGILNGLAVTKLHALDQLPEAVGAVELAPMMLGRFGELENPQRPGGLCADLRRRQGQQALEGPARCRVTGSPWFYRSAAAPSRTCSRWGLRYARASSVRPGRRRKRAVLRDP